MVLSCHIPEKDDTECPVFMNLQVPAIPQSNKNAKSSLPLSPGLKGFLGNGLKQYLPWAQPFWRMICIICPQG